MEDFVLNEIYNCFEKLFIVNNKNELSNYINNSKYGGFGKEVEEIFEENDTEYLYENGFSLNDKKDNINHVKAINFVINILKSSLYNQNESKICIDTILNIFERNNYEYKSDNSEIKINCYKSLGEGSYCKVYQMKKNSVLKTLLPNHLDNAEQIKRLKYEFENMKKLEDNINILNVFEYNPIDNSYTMAKAKENLHNYLDNDFITKKPHEIIYDIINGMEYAHSKQIIHRDLHVGNVLYIEDRFVISDFGLSKDLEIERSFLSTESIRSYNKFVDPIGLKNLKLLDKQSDIYSIGKIIEEIYYRMPNSNFDLLKISDKCISDRRHRYTEISQIKSDLKSILEKSNAEEIKKETKDNIKNNKYTINVAKHIFLLISNELLHKYIIDNNLNNFHLLILQFMEQEQIRIMKYLELDMNLVRIFEDYDIFITITYNLYNSTNNKYIKDVCINIIEYCANVVNRFYAQNLLKEIREKELL